MNDLTVELNTPGGLVFSATASSIDVRTEDGSIHITPREESYLNMIHATEITLQTADGPRAFVLENAVAGLKGGTFTVLAERIPRAEPETLPDPIPMKPSIHNTLKAGLLGLLAISMASCQSTGGSAAGGPAVMCDKCQTVWVKRPVNSGSAGKGGGFTTYRNVKAMQCPDCENAIVTFFKTGAFKHHCDHCGGTMTHCEAH